MSASEITRPRVLKRKGLYGPIPEGAVYVGRPSKWANPFKVGRDGDRAECIARFREYAARRLIREGIGWLEPLRGKDLVCHCSPLPCHGDILLELLYGEGKL